MASAEIVEHFDAIEDVCSSEFACFIDSSFDALLFQTAKEGFSHCIVPAVPASSHARLQYVFTAEPQPIIATVLGEPWSEWISVLLGRRRQTAMSVNVLKITRMIASKTLDDFYAVARRREFGSDPNKCRPPLRDQKPRGTSPCAASCASLRRRSGTHS